VLRLAADEMMNGDLATVGDWIVLSVAPRAAGSCTSPQDSALFVMWTNIFLAISGRLDAYLLHP
jgi:hypothetical protein